MTEREKFEAAIKALAELPEDSHETPYPDEDANTYWAIWQASRRAALDEAAAICDALANGFVSDVNPHRSREAAYGAKDCEKSIRALAAPTHGEPNV